jgi:hypothetical protein
VTADSCLATGQRDLFSSKLWNEKQRPALCQSSLYVLCRAAIWFVVHHFWFLDVKVGGLPVRLLCRLLLAALTPAVLLPGLIRSGASKSLVSTPMLLQVMVAGLFLAHSGECPALQDCQLLSLRRHVFSHTADQLT